MWDAEVGPTLNVASGMAPNAAAGAALGGRECLDDLDMAFDPHSRQNPSE